MPIGTPRGAVGSKPGFDRRFTHSSLPAVLAAEKSWFRHCFCRKTTTQFVPRVPEPVHREVCWLLPRLRGARNPVFRKKPGFFPGRVRAWRLSQTHRHCPDLVLDHLREIDAW